MLINLVKIFKKNHGPVNVDECFLVKKRNHR